ncbi:MAG: flagellar biosynthesis anti-sigma factor FlgM [Gammaproteobacteria bacterium]|jgi:flagellar biosynthesis anti-sigma factor FlgM
MTDAIITQNRLQSATIKSEAKPSAEPDLGQPPVGANNTPTNSGAAAIVKLSSSNVLNDLNTSITQQPEVNKTKIESIKLALAQGEYQPNAEVIAKKFSEIEKLLP